VTRHLAALVALLSLTACTATSSGIGSRPADRIFVVAASLAPFSHCIERSMNGYASRHGAAARFVPQVDRSAAEVQVVRQGDIWLAIDMTADDGSTVIEMRRGQRPVEDRSFDEAESVLRACAAR
jgi:hypothetical protein